MVKIDNEKKWFDMLNTLANFTSQDHQSGETVVDTVTRVITELRRENEELINAIK